MDQEVKVIIEWNRNTAGLHEEPMTVHIAGKSDPNEIVGAVAKAMGAIDERDDKKSGHIEPEHDGGAGVRYVDGGEYSFSAFHVTADCSGHECSSGNTGGFIVADYGK